jgi:4'-phosphopantetheinyl transferase
MRNSGYLLIGLNPEANGVVFGEMNMSSQPQLDALIRTVAGPPERSAHVAAWALDCGEAGVVRVSTLVRLAALPPRPPKARELFLWFGAPSAAEWDDFLPCLDRAERERAAKFHQAADRWCYAAAHAGLRTLLGTALGAAPTEIDFVFGPNGKPQLDPARHGAGAARAMQFNISHTRGLVAVAIAADAVGIDVECRKEMRDLVAVADRVFTTESRMALAETAQEDARTAMFFRFWSLGEAFIKATGEGITQGFSTFAFTAHGAPRLLRVGDAWGPPARWRFGVL